MSTPVFPTALPGFSIKFAREPITDVLVATASSGAELRSSWQYVPRYKYQLDFELLRGTTLLEYQTLLNHFSRTFGQLAAFLISDPDDNAVTAHGFGVGDGATTAFQLQRCAAGYLYDNTGGPWPKLTTLRTNLLAYSQSLSTGASWTASGVTATGNVQVAPDSTITATALAVTTTGTLKQAAGSAGGSAYTFSFWIQAGSGLSGSLAILDTTGSTTVATTAFTGSSGSGWQRISVTGTPTSGHNISVQITATGSGGIYAWGAQLETGSVATSYIVSVSSTSTSLSPSYYPYYTDGFEPIFDINTSGSFFGIYVAGSLQTPGTNYSISSSGLVTFTSAPSANAQLTWSGSYFRRVRFADKSIKYDRIVTQWYEAKSINLLSVLA